MDVLVQEADAAKAKMMDDYMSQVKVRRRANLI